MQQTISAPTAKVVASAIAAFATPIILGVLVKAYPSLPLPVNASDLLNTVILGAVVGIITLASGYIKAPSVNDQIVPTPPPAPIQYAPLPQRLAPTPVVQTPAPAPSVAPTSIQSVQQAPQHADSGTVPPVPLN